MSFIDKLLYAMNNFTFHDSIQNIIILFLAYKYRQLSLIVKPDKTDKVELDGNE